MKLRSLKKAATNANRDSQIREKEKTARTAESRKLCCNREKITEQRTVSTDRKHECFSAKYIINIFCNVATNYTIIIDVLNNVLEDCLV